MRRLGLLAVCLLAVTTAFAQAQYEPGTVFVVRVGINANSTNVGGANVATGVNIVPYQNISGTWTAGSALSASPTGTSALTVGPTATSEGALTISSNGQYLGLAGYRTGTVSSGTDRVIARIDLSTATFAGGGTASTVDTTTAMPASEGYSGTSGNIRSAVWSSDGTRYWSAGTGSTSAGTRTGNFATTSGSTQVSTTPTNTRVVGIFNGQLYTSSSSGAFTGVSTVGTGTPTNTGNTTTLIANTASGSSPYGFAISPDGKTMYIADDRAYNSGSLSASGGIQKWIFNDTLATPAWQFSTTFATAASSTVGARGLAVDFNTDPANPIIYATTTETNNNRLISFQDVGGSATSYTVIASAGSNDVFRGVAMTPTPEPAAILAIGAAGLGLVGLVRRRRMQAQLPGGNI